MLITLCIYSISISVVYSPILQVLALLIVSWDAILGGIVADVLSSGIMVSKRWDPTLTLIQKIPPLGQMLDFALNLWEKSKRDDHSNEEDPSPAYVLQAPEWRYLPHSLLHAQKVIIECLGRGRSNLIVSA